MKIVEYKNCENVVVEFQDEYKCRKNTSYVNFQRGQVKNPYDKTACGVGYVGEGKYLTKENGRSTKLYSCWVHMLERCYYEKNQNLHQSYYGTCSVCDEWLNFQVFAKWHEEHSYKVNERLHLDKDILFPGNKEIKYILLINVFWFRSVLINYLHISLKIMGYQSAFVKQIMENMEQDIVTAF